MNMTRKISNISIVGYGFVGRAMAKFFHSQGVEVRQILLRKLPQERDEFRFITKIELLQVCDLLLVCVNDDALLDLIPQLPKSQWIAYTSGAVGLEVFNNAPHISVFYPLQSFAFLPDGVMTQVPILIESSNREHTQTLKNFVETHFDICQEMDSASRSKLHLAAVFANNFSNHLMTSAAQYCVQNKVDFNLLKPLILETAKKWMNHDPSTLQTGPAIRGDETVVAKHISQLDGSMKAIYQEMTASIMKFHNKHE